MNHPKASPMQPLPRAPALFLSFSLALLALTGCGRSPQTEPAADVAAPPGPTDAEASQAEADRAAALAAKEKEIADREAAVQQREIEQQLAQRAAEAEAEAAAARAARSKATVAKKQTASPKPAAVAAARPASPPPPPPPPILVPAGTQLAVELTAGVSTKTAQVGNRVQGRLASDLVVGGRRAAAAGSPVQGTVTQVVSGSRKVGGTPTLGIAFDSLTVSGSAPIAINAQLVQQAASDTAKDTAKIVGTAAAGAIIGHQVNHKNGSIVGGILGGAAGTAVAANTGGEVSLPAGTVVSVALGNSFQVAGD
jgi:predicted small lipoprotein YifL